MALTRTWATQAINQALDTSSLVAWHKDVLLQFKKFITGANPVAAAGAWTVEKSSNGVTSGASDLWTTVADLVWAADASAHSWIEFKSPSGYMPNGAFVYMLVSCGGSVDTHTLRIYFSGAPWTGGDASNDPVNVNLPSRIGNAANFQWQSDTIGGLSSWHGTRNTFGDFVFLVSKNGGGMSCTSFCGFSLGNSQAADAFPFLCQANYNEADNGSAGKGALSRQMFDGAVSRCTMLWIGGQRLLDGDAAMYVSQPRNVNDNQSWLNIVGTDAIDPSKIIAWPAHVVTNTTYPAYRGRIVDVDLTSQVPQFTTEPSGTQERCVIGGYLVPFSTSPTF